MDASNGAVLSKGSSANEKLRFASMKRVRSRWTAEETDALFAALENAPTYEIAAQRLGLTQKTICARMSVLRSKGDPRACGRPIISTLEIQMPADFAERASVSKNAELIERYNVSKATISKWRAATGTSRKQGGIHSASDSDAFDTRTPTPRRKAESAARPTQGRPGRGQVVSIDRNSMRDMSRAGQAAEFLRRMGPVFRCDESGKPEGQPTHWRRGSFVLTGDEIIERAQRNGWQPDAWRRIAA